MSIFSFDWTISSVFNYLRPVNQISCKVNVTSELILTDSEELYILIPPLHYDYDYYRVIKKRISSKGSACVEYKIDSSLLSADVQETIKQFKTVSDKVVLDIASLKLHYGFKKVVIIGVSIGCVQTMMIADKCSNISRIILVVPGNCLAESVWKGVRTQNIRRVLESRGVSMDGLKSAWAELAPENNLTNLVGKDITVYLSMADMVIPYEQGQKLIEGMKRQGLCPIIVKNKHLGHYVTALRFYLSPKV
ncbi:MAG: hypothetical protein WCO09_05120 [bacterium]